MTCYLQKMSYDVFAIVDCRDDQGYVYLASETIGPQNADHTCLISLIILANLEQYQAGLHAWTTLTHVPPTKIFIWLHIAKSWFKRESSAFFRLSFMIAGHTKFNTDRLFSRIANLIQPIQYWGLGYCCWYACTCHYWWRWRFSECKECSSVIFQT